MSATKSSIPRPTAELLRELYEVRRLGCPEIGALFERDAKTVLWWLRQAGIQTRPRGSDVRQQFKTGHSKGVPRPKMSAETRKKIGAKSINRNWRRGDDHWMRKIEPHENPNWKGGATPERQTFYRSREWKAACCAVWARADACCERCGADYRLLRKSIPKFHVHHVWPFQIRETRAHPALLVLLCRPCHLFVHSKANVTREYLPQDLSEPAECLLDRLGERPVMPAELFIERQRRCWAAYEASMRGSSESVA